MSGKVAIIGAGPAGLAAAYSLGKLGYEAQLWQMADALRNNMDAAEYKHIVLDLIFLKYISDAFEDKHAELEAQKRQGADPEDRDEYRVASIFWVPKEARWQHLRMGAPQPNEKGKVYLRSVRIMLNDLHGAKRALW